MPTDAYNQTLHAERGEDSVLVALEITHPALVDSAGAPTPIRVVSALAGDDVEIEGNQYIAIPFAAVPPDQNAEQPPRAELRIDNIGREILDPIQKTAGGAGADIRMMQVLRSAPDEIQWEQTMQILGITITERDITFQIGFENLLDGPAVRAYFDEENYPGLFA